MVVNPNSINKKKYWFIHTNTSLNSTNKTWTSKAWCCLNMRTGKTATSQVEQCFMDNMLNMC